MKSSYERVTLSVPTQIIERIDAVARDQSRSRSAQVSFALKDFLARTSPPMQSQEPKS